MYVIQMLDIAITLCNWNSSWKYAKNWINLALFKLTHKKVSIFRYFNPSLP